ncbi:hypothetical protein HW555_002225 [Spodoptera exigua]|uniref:Uncharacterized protein n=1 Tax=Spodoptera exigua TaxID=7107 RepID=A0A835GQ49_SPOEX|nr:hypothetical protein HW555_002225 [Spodoptera exigua]
MSGSSSQGIFIMSVLAAGMRRKAGSMSPTKDVEMSQKPVDTTLWCVCEVCGLRIHPLLRTNTPTDVKKPSN